MSKALKGGIFLFLGLAVILMAFALVTVYRRAHRDFVFSHTINTLSSAQMGDGSTSAGSEWDANMPSASSYDMPAQQPPLDSAMPGGPAAASAMAEAGGGANHSGLELSTIRKEGRPNTSKYDRLPLVPNIDEE